MKPTLALFLLVPVLASGQTMPRPRIYVDPDNPLSNAFSAGVQKKQVPLTLTADSTQLDYTVSLTAESDKGSKAKGVTTAILTGVYNSGAWDRVSMNVIDSKTKDVVFGYTCQKGRGACKPSRNA